MQLQDDLVKTKKQPKGRGIRFILFYIIIALFVITEIVLRMAFGFGRAVLYRTDPDFEYIAIPQDTRRLGNHVFYNSYSQRSPEITPADSIIILGFGDSILNGGTQIDNDSLATAKLSTYLTRRYRKPVKVLNISSQSWGPDNCYAYLKKYGDFNARAMFLVLSSHDAYDDMDFQKVVGVNPSFPDKQYRFAIAELLDRYIVPKLVPEKGEHTSNNGMGIDKKKPGAPFNPGILNLYRYAKQHNLPFIIYLHADIGETEKGAYSEYGQEIISFCARNNIPLVKELDYHLLKEDAYRDGIHLTNLGQDLMFRILRDKVYDYKGR